MGYTQPRKVEERIAHEVVLLVGMALLAIVQATLLPAPLGFPPALVLVAVICRVLIGSPRPDNGVGETLRGAFYGGITLDICSATLLGSHALAMVIVATLVFVIAGKVHLEGFLLIVLSVVVGGIVYEFLLALVYTATVAPLVWDDYLVVIMLPSMLSLLVLALPVCYLVRWLVSRGGRLGLRSRKDEFS